MISMKTQVRESYDPPKGYTVEVSPGWPTILTALDHPGQGNKPIPETDYADGRVPASFEVAVMQGKAGEPDGWMSLMTFTVIRGEIRLYGFYAWGMEADEGLKAVTQIRPMHWWKRFAVSEIYKRKLGLLADIKDDDEFMQRAMAIQSELAAVLQRPVTRRHNRITDEKLREVAAVYRGAIHSGENPTRAVQSHFSAKAGYKISYPTIARWVAASRKIKDGLGPAVGKFQAGEKTND